jgi:Mg-chelatase subunit ChlD
MPRYIEVVHAAHETATKILALRLGPDGRRYRVAVTAHGGQTASVTWDAGTGMAELNMPGLPPDAILTRAEADRLVAFIGHECCHVLHSDMAVWKAAVADGARVQAWTNALEDVRIEAVEIAAGKFPALQGLLASIANHLHAEALGEAAKRKRVIGADVADAPYVACILRRIANGYSIPAAGNLADAMSPEVSRLMTVALAGVRRAASTADVLTLARTLVALENQAPKGRDKGQDKPEGQDEGRGDDQGDDQGEGEGEEGRRQGQGERKDGGGPEGEAEGQGEGEPEQDAAPAGDGATGSGSPGISTDPNLKKTITTIAKRAGVKPGAYNPSHHLSVVKGEIDYPQPPAGIGPGHNAMSASALNQRLPRNAVLSGQIGRLLVSEEARRVTHHEGSGRLDRRALTRMRAGAVDVYSQRVDTPGVDTALLVLIDGSSSMCMPTGPAHNRGPSRMDMALTSAWHIANAAELAGAKVAVTVFHGSSRSDVRVSVIKDWSTPLRDRAAMLADVSPGGSTPMSPAIMVSAKMLASVSAATRRIMMVLTDGDCDYGPEAVTKACILAGDDGVEVVGIGMDAGEDVVKAFPPRYSVDVKDLAQLAATGLGVLVNMLEDANPQAAD